jgi:acetate kinase
VGERVKCLGFEVDGKKNGKLGSEVVEDIGREDVGKRVLVCQTDEEAEMAEECAQNAEELRRPESA